MKATGATRSATRIEIAASTASSPAQAGDPVFQSGNEFDDSCGVLDAPPARGMTGAHQDYLTNSFIARSSPPSVSGYIRPPMMLRTIWIDWVKCQVGSDTGLSHTQAG